MIVYIGKFPNVPALGGRVNAFLNTDLGNVKVAPF